MVWCGMVWYDMVWYGIVGMTAVKTSGGYVVVGRHVEQNEKCGQKTVEHKHVERKYMVRYPAWYGIWYNVVVQ